MAAIPKKEKHSIENCCVLSQRPMNWKQLALLLFVICSDRSSSKIPNMSSSILSRTVALKLFELRTTHKHVCTLSIVVHAMQ